MNTCQATHPDPDDPRAVILSAEAMVSWLAEGRQALLPTDTLPALASTPRSSGGIWSMKRRSLEKPLILMGASMEQLIESLLVPWQQPWKEKASVCWPGAVTLVLPLRGSLTDLLHPGGESLGLRVPACGMTRALLRLTGPLATTSANLSGHLPATTAAEASRSFPDLPLLGPLPWPPGSGQASEVLEWDPQADQWRVLRPRVPRGGGSGASP